MGDFKVRIFAVIVAVGALAGCSGANQAIVGQPKEPAPVEYRALTLAAAKATYFDPYSIRDAQISEPQWLGSWNIGEASGWVVCVRANAKNRMGAYIGIQDTAFMFRGGKMTGNLTDLPAGGGYYCGSAVFSAFTELEGA